MAGDPFAPCEESKRNTDLLSKAKVVTFHWSPIVAYSVLNKPTG
jgi:hypothetical protein